MSFHEITQMKFTVSFHTPLQRILAILLSFEMKKGILCEKGFEFHPHFLLKIVQFPLRILVCYINILHKKIA